MSPLAALVMCWAFPCPSHKPNPATVGQYHVPSQAAPQVHSRVTVQRGTKLQPLFFTSLQQSWLPGAHWWVHTYMYTRVHGCESGSTVTFLTDLDWFNDSPASG